MFSPLIALAPAHWILITWAGVLSFCFARGIRRCPEGKVMVVYGKVAGKQACLIKRAGVRFVWPLIQDSRLLDLEPFDVNVNGVTHRVAIRDDPEHLMNAAFRLLGLDTAGIAAQARAVLAEGGDLGALGLELRANR